MAAGMVMAEEDDEEVRSAILGSKEREKAMQQAEVSISCSWEESEFSPNFPFRLRAPHSRDRASPIPSTKSKSLTICPCRIRIIHSKEIVSADACSKLSAEDVRGTSQTLRRPRMFIYSK